MVYLINRILYSCFCLEIYIDECLNKLLAPLMKWIINISYSLDLFGELERKNISKEEYKRYFTRTHKSIMQDIDNGFCAQRAQGNTVGIFMMYSFLIVSFLRYEKILYLDESYFFHILMGLGFASFIVVYWVAFRNEKYKEYFKKFRREKNRKFKDACWNIITFVLYVGILYCIAQSVILWYK